MLSTRYLAIFLGSGGGGSLDIFRRKLNKKNPHLDHKEEGSTPNFLLKILSLRHISVHFEAFL